MTELRLRLIKDGKIVGYELHKDGNIHHSSDIQKLLGDGYSWCDIDDGAAAYGLHPTYINHDSFDLSIKAGDSWLFNNDIVMDDPSEFGEQFILIYNAGWMLENTNIDLGTVAVTDLDGLKRIGTIYDEKGSE